jgi:hypothetical protein
MRLSVAVVVLFALGTMSLLPPLAFAETEAEAAADCEVRLGFAPGGCKCIVAKWQTFNVNQRTYVAALAGGDVAGAKAVETAMSDKELGQAGFFMATITSAFASC